MELIVSYFWAAELTPETGFRSHSARWADRAKIFPQFSDVTTRLRCPGNARGQNSFQCRGRDSNPHGPFEPEDFKSFKGR